MGWRGHKEVGTVADSGGIGKSRLVGIEGHWAGKEWQWRKVESGVSGIIDNFSESPVAD